MSPPHLRATWCAAVVALFIAHVAHGARALEVRPISDAERAAVQAAAGFLSGGPEAIHSELATASPLRRLPKEEALEEIEARLGPHSGAVWELQTVVPALQDKMAVFSVNFPSGIDETLMLEMAQEGSSYKIANIRILAEKSPNPPVFAPKPSATAAATNEEHPEEKPVRPFALVVGLLAVAMTAGAALIGRRSPAGMRMLLGASLFAIAAGALVAVKFDDRFRWSPREQTAVKAKVDTGPVRLSPLLPLRRAIAAGNAENVDSLYRSVGANPARDVADLWKAQWDLQQLKTDDIARALRRFPSPSDVPLAEILRARAANFEGKEVDSIVSYERAVSLGPGRDGLWYEVAQSMSTLGYDERARGYLQRLARIGSRNAGVYYSLAVIDAEGNKNDDSQIDLRKAWTLKPVERANLVRAQVLWSVLRRPDVTSYIKLSDASEATFSSPAISSRAISLPADGSPRVSGDFLDVTIGQQELVVPGGAVLAPSGTPVVDAGNWTRSEERKAIADLPQLLTVPHTAGSFTQPQLRLRITRAAEALAMHNSWPQLLRLTDGLSPRWENVPPELLFLRNTALQRTQRMDEARQLLEALAVNAVVNRKNEPSTMLELAEMLAAMDEYDPAIKLMDRAAGAHQMASIDDRVRQLQMNRRLATKYATLKTEHFEVHYPDDVTVTFAQQFGSVLEAEYKRLQKFVPTPNFRPVVVNVLWWRDFRSTYTGSDFILGFYQGKLTLPLAGIPAFVPQIVAILTHELTHALIAQATNDQAPHWFHEGLAQRLEMRPFHANAFNMYEDDKLLSVSLLDAVIKGSPDPEMIQEGYIESQTVIRFIEATYGPTGVPKMLEAFRAGATTDEAIFKLSGLTTAAFDTKLRAWGRSGAKVFENPPPVRYDVISGDQPRWTKQGSLETPRNRRDG